MLRRPERESSLSRDNFWREIAEPIKRIMEKAIAQATSKEDAEKRIKEMLPKDRSFLGPLVSYNEQDMGDGKKRVQFPR